MEIFVYLSKESGTLTTFYNGLSGINTFIILPANESKNVMSVTESVALISVAYTAF